MHAHKMRSVTEPGFKFSRQTHKEEQTLVFANGSTAAQEAQEKEHASHAQDDVDTGEEQGVGRHDFPESCGVHQHPHTHSQEKRAPQLTGRRDENNSQIKQKLDAFLEL